MSLVFYDTETTGLKAPFDQILQFAAIRTDPDLNEIDRLEIRSRLLPHVVPSPGAMHVTGITVDQLTDQSLPSHYEMVRSIRAKLLPWRPSNFVGYNSIGFDEHFFRQALYQTLHPPYLTNTDGNTRTDIMHIAQAAALFVPKALVIPVGSRGKRIFKLDEVAPANGFQHKNAHDAMADVEATIYLSRILVEKAPEVWSAAMRFSKKATVEDFIQNELVFSLTEFFFNNPNSWFVTLIGTSKEIGSVNYVYNLDVDPASLVGLKPAELVKRLGAQPKPVRSLKSNGGPTLMTAAEAPDIAAGINLGIDELERRANVLKAKPEFCERLITAFMDTKEETESSPYVEEQIYEEFTSNEDLLLLDAFHKVPWENRMPILGKLKDKRLQQLGKQLIHIERPDVLDEVTRRDHDRTRAMRLTSTDIMVPWLTLPKALEDLNGLLSSADSKVVARLRQHHTYLNCCLEQSKVTVGSAVGKSKNKP